MWALYVLKVLHPRCGKVQRAGQGVENVLAIMLARLDREAAAGRL